MNHFLDTRQLYLIDKRYAKSAQASTILITGIPKKFLREDKLGQLFSYLPGGVRKVWLNRDMKDLPDVYDRRMKACKLLEKAETKLIHTAVALDNKKTKQAEKDETKRLREAEKDKKNSSSVQSDQQSRASGSTSGEPLRHSDVDDFARPPMSPVEEDGPAESDASDLERGKAADSLADRLVPREMRPKKTLPLGFLPFGLPLLSKKVDAIEWARDEILKTTKLLEEGRSVMREELGDDAAPRLGGITGLYKGGHGIMKKARNRIDDDSESDLSSDPDAPRKPKLGRAERKQLKKQKKEEAKRKAIERKAKEKRQKNTTYPPLNSAFVLFNEQVAAHLAVQALAHHEPYAMAKRYIGVAPGDVIWGNLGLDPREMRIRSVISYAITLGLIILWSFPVAFIGAISNVSSLCTTYHWLSWLCQIPDTVVGLIQGVLPTLLLAILMMLLPIVLRLLARFEGIPRRSGLELSLMTRYFCFQVIVSHFVHLGMKKSHAY
jgi:calcium permeable stress-gated cation channel